MRAFLLTLFLVAATTASAQPDSTVGTQPRKSLGAAYVMGIASTVGSVALGNTVADAEWGGETLGGVIVLGGVLFGPSVGRIYAEDGAPYTSVLLRGAGLLTTVLGAAGSFGCGFGEGCGSNEDLYAALLLGGLGLTGYSVVLDLIFTHRAVRAYNERPARVSFAPGYDARSGAPLLGIRVDF